MASTFTMTYTSDNPNINEPITKTVTLDDNATAALAAFIAEHPQYAAPEVNEESGDETPVDLRTMAERMLEGTINGMIANIDRHAKEAVKKVAEDSVASVSDSITIS